MAKNKATKNPDEIEVTDVVYHKAHQEPQSGIVVGIITYTNHKKIIVDWGGGNESECFPETLTHTYTPKFDN